MKLETQEKMEIIEQALSILSKPEQLAISQSEELESVLTGYSGIKIINLLKELSLLFTKEANDTCYLEVGVFQGLTLLSVAKSVSKLSCYGIDNFAFFDPDKKNLSMIKERESQLNVNNAYLVNMDYEDALEDLYEVIENKKIGVYFVDGPHDYRSQLMCLQLAIPYLHKNALIVIDDCNYAHVRQANRDFLVTHPEFKLLFQSYTRCHPKNMDEREREEVAKKGWWNGINVIARDVEQRLEQKYPPTIRDRKLYENEHLIHASKYADDAPKIISLSQQICNEKNFIKKIIKTKQFWYILKESQNKHKNKFNSMNTDSSNLPIEDLNKMT